MLPKGILGELEEVMLGLETKRMDVRGLEAIKRSLAISEASMILISSGSRTNQDHRDT